MSDHARSELAADENFDARAHLAALAKTRLHDSAQGSSARKGISHSSSTTSRRVDSR